MMKPSTLHASDKHGISSQDSQCAAGSVYSRRPRRITQTKKKSQQSIRQQTQTDEQMAAVGNALRDGTKKNTQKNNMKLLENIAIKLFHNSEKQLERVMVVTLILFSAQLLIRWICM